MTKTLHGRWSRTRLVDIGASMMYGVGIAKSNILRTNDQKTLNCGANWFVDCFFKINSSIITIYQAFAKPSLFNYQQTPKSL